MTTKFYGYWLCPRHLEMVEKEFKRKINGISYSNSSLAKLDNCQFPLCQEEGNKVCISTNETKFHLA